MLTRMTRAALEARYDVREVPGTVACLVSRCGEVFTGSQGGWRQLTQSRTPYGYRVVTVAMASGGRKTQRVHRLVALAWHPNPHRYPLVRHLDSDPGNNHADNLAWGTVRENRRDFEQTPRAQAPLFVWKPTGGRVRRPPADDSPIEKLRAWAEDKAERRARAARLQEVQRRLGVASATFAEMLGVRETTLARMLCGETKIADATVRQLEQLAHHHERGTWRQVETLTNRGTPG